MCGEKKSGCDTEHWKIDTFWGLHNSLYRCQQQMSVCLSSSKHKNHNQQKKKRSTYIPHMNWQQYEKRGDYFFFFLNGYREKREDIQCQNSSLPSFFFTCEQATITRNTQKWRLYQNRKILCCSKDFKLWILREKKSHKLITFSILKFKTKKRLKSQTINAIKSKQYYYFSFLPFIPTNLDLHRSICIINVSDIS